MFADKWKHEEDELGHYFILGIEPNATQDEIEIAYYEQREAWSAYESPETKQRLKRIEAAYAILSDARMRSFYDAPALEREQLTARGVVHEIQEEWEYNTMPAPQGDLLVSVPIRKFSKLEEAQINFPELRKRNSVLAFVNGVVTPALLIGLAFYEPVHAKWSIPVAIGLFVLTTYATFKTRLWRRLSSEWSCILSASSVCFLGYAEIIAAIVALVVAIVIVLLVVWIVFVMFGIALAIITAVASS